jgi:hypothetical protein
MGAAVALRAALADVEQLGDGVQEAKARHRIGLAADGLERIAGRIVRETRKYRGGYGLPEDLAAAIAALPEEEER